MAYSAGDYEAVHPNPAWSAKADFIIAAYLGSEDGRNQWEQIPCRRLGPDRFEVCCIPFFAANICLGDIVQTNSVFTIVKTLAPSGHVTFRIWLAGQDEPERREILSHISRISEHLEWSSHNLLAVSARDHDAVVETAACLQAIEDRFGAPYETGRLAFGLES